MRAGAVYPAALMSVPAIQVTVLDSSGVRQRFSAGLVELDCGGGRIEIRPGGPAFCRGFEHGVLVLDDGASVTALDILGGMASLNGDAVHVVCERATPLPPQGTTAPETLFSNQATGA